MNSLINNQKICLTEFIPSKVIHQTNPEKSFDLSIENIGNYLKLWYSTGIYNHKGLVGKRKHELLFPKYARRNQETFEVLGLLQAEMGKQHDGKIVFCNHEYKLVKKVMKWFEREFDLPKDSWKWYIKININEPSDENYRKEVEEKVVRYWVSKIGLSLEWFYPKRVSYIKNTKNTKLKFYDYGTLIMEMGSNLFSQILKNFLKNTTQSILNYEKEEIKYFIRGIIAGESCVEINIPSKKFRIHISATNQDEKLIYHDCLKKLGIGSIIYKGDKLVVSKKQNNLQLLKQKLMTLSPEKYNKFLRMMNLYGNFEGLKEWRNNLQKPHNKIPQEKINKIIKLYNQHPKLATHQIAEIVDISDIKVQRVLKERNLGKRLIKTPESKRREIALFAKENQNLTQKQIAKIFHAHENVVRRAVSKYAVVHQNL